MREVGKKRDPVVILILGLVTCGIYWFYWEYQVAKEVNQFLGREEISPGLALFGALCCLPITIYVEYLIVKALPVMQREAGMPPEQPSMPLHIALAILFGPVEAMILQSELNRIWAAAGPKTDQLGS